MQEFVFKWRMSGEVRIRALTRDAAQEEYDEKSLYEIADTNDEYDFDPPMTDEEIADKRAMEYSGIFCGEQRHG